jgi:UDP-N-acetylmuramoyl-tripeptide--D-alanyl-D-alanine ligase
MRWSLVEVAVATGGWLEGPSCVQASAEIPTHQAPDDLTGVAIDSRLLAEGALFVAVRAERDGHDWVDAAVRAGAGAVMVERTWAESGPRSGFGIPSVVVPDTRSGLLALGAAARDRLRAIVVGVTGSVGKTSTKDLAAAAVGATLRFAASEKSFNNELGVPLTLANAPGDSEVAIIEMGARGRGHITQLCRVARPEIGVVTAVAPAHTEVFGDLDAVAAAKAELVEALPSGGTAILNGDDPRVRDMRTRAACAVLTYSAGGLGAGRADMWAEDLVLDEELRPRFVVHSPWGGPTPLRLEVRGVHQVGNALAALAVACTCGVPIEAATAALAASGISPWRMELRRTPSGGAILNDAYNANPTSMAAALEALAALPARRRVAVLGAMAELGAQGPAAHRAVAALAGQLGVQILAVSTDAYGGRSVPGIEEAVAALGPLGSGDAILVKASRVEGLERLAARLLEGT